MNTDYTRLLKAELIILLNEKEAEILELKSQIQQLIKTQNESGIIIENFQNQLDVPQQKDVVDVAENIIQRLLTLDNNEMKRLPFLARTTESGIQAYMGFNHGVLDPLKNPINDKDEPLER